MIGSLLLLLLLLLLLMNDSKNDSLVSCHELL